MSVNKWLGTAADGNWANTANWSLGAIPVDNDQVLVSATAVSGMTQNLDRTADSTGAGLDLDLFHVERGFHYNIGSSANRLSLVADKIKIENDGEFWFHSDADTALSTDRVIINGPCYANIKWTRGAAPVLDFRNGEIIIDLQGPTVWAPFMLVTAESGVPDVQITNNVVGGNTASAEFFMQGGKFEWNDVGDDGCIIHLADGEVVFTRGRVVRLNQYGGTFYFDATTGSLMGAARCIAGVFDSTRTLGTKTATLLLRGPLLEYLVDTNTFTATTETILGQ